MGAGPRRRGPATRRDARRRRACIRRVGGVRERHSRSAPAARGRHPGADAARGAVYRSGGTPPSGTAPVPSAPCLRAPNGTTPWSSTALRRVARVWRALDDALVRLGVEALATAQDLSDAFRRARRLGDRGPMLGWLRENDLDVEGYTRLVSAEARLVMLCDGTCAHSLGLTDGAEAVCWLLDAIRLAGLYRSPGAAAGACQPRAARGPREERRIGRACCGRTSPASASRCRPTWTPMPARTTSPVERRSSRPASCVARGDLLPGSTTHGHAVGLRPLRRVMPAPLGEIVRHLDLDPLVGARLR